MKRQERTCSHEGCEIPLRPHNKSGLCKNHNKGQKAVRRVLSARVAKLDPDGDPTMGELGEPVRRLVKVYAALGLDTHAVTRTIDSLVSAYLDRVAKGIESLE